MKRFEVDLETKEVREIDLTEREIAELAAKAAAQAADPQHIAAVAEQQARKELRLDSKFQNLINKTPAQVKNWCENNFPSLTLSEQRDLATIVMAISILGRRL